MSIVLGELAVCPECNYNGAKLLPLSGYMYDKNGNVVKLDIAIYKCSKCLNTIGLPRKLL